LRNQAEKVTHEKTKANLQHETNCGRIYDAENLARVEVSAATRQGGTLHQMPATGDSVWVMFETLCPASVANPEKAEQPPSTQREMGWRGEIMNPKFFIRSDHTASKCTTRF
jgi:hypothetical protein